jgi:hypothetical protein
LGFAGIMHQNLLTISCKNNNFVYCTAECKSYSKMVSK